MKNFYMEIVVTAWFLNTMVVLLEHATMNVVDKPAIILLGILTVMIAVENKRMNKIESNERG